MISFDVSAFFKKLQSIPGLQNSKWEENQSGVDRGMESILIQLCTREIATYVLARLRLVCMPDLAPAVQSDRSFGASEVNELVTWAKTQSGGCSTLVKVLALNEGMESPRSLAAAASLRYYRNRSDPNPVVKSPWTEEGLAAASEVQCDQLLEYPTRGERWEKKCQAVIDLVRHIRRTPIAGMTDDEAYSSLRTIGGVGHQSASMISLFWLDRPQPIIDDYLKRALTAWSMLPDGFHGKRRKEDEELQEHLRRGAVVVAKSMPGWTPQRVLACIYLWCCETGRFRLGGLEPSSEHA